MGKLVKKQNSKTVEKVRRIEVFAEAHSIEKLRKQVIAGQPDAGKFAFISDEGEYAPKGESTAPTPLSYFVAGMALWLLSHVSQVAAKKRLVLHDERVKVTAYFQEQGSVLKGTSTGRCERFDVTLSIDSDEPEDEIVELIRLSHKMCFTESALTENVELRCKDQLNGQQLNVDLND